MNDIYVFIATQNGLISYPNDQTHNYFQYAISKAKNNAQIVLVRKDNLLHYCYVRKINNKQIFGLCLRLDRIYSDAKDLFRAFDSTVSKLVESGVILQIDDKANIKLCVSNFVSETVAVKEMSDTLIHALGITQKNTVPLPPADYSISINDCIELSLEDSTNVQIINAIKKYSNVYIVKTHDEISRVTEFANLIKKKNGEINQLQDTIIQQDKTISNLEIQRNNFRLVLCLLSFIFVGTIIFYFFAQSKYKIIDDQTDKIETLNSDVQSKNTRIQNLKQNVLSLEKELENANTTITNLKKTNELVTDSLKQTSSELNEIYSYFSDIPFVITNIEIANTDKGGAIETNYGYRIYSSNTMYLTPKIKYIGLSSGNRNLRVKLYDSSGNLSKGTFKNKPSPDDCTYSEYFYLSKGKNDCTLVGWGNENKGNWKKGKYRFEIWSDGLCLGIKRFEVY